MTAGEIGGGERRGDPPSLWPASAAVVLVVAVAFSATMFDFEERFTPLGGVLASMVFLWLARRFGIRASAVDIVRLPALAIVGFALAAVVRWTLAHTSLAFGPWFDQATRAALADSKNGPPSPLGAAGYALHGAMVFVTGLGVAYGPLIVRFWPYCWHCHRYATGGYSLLLPGGLPRPLFGGRRAATAEDDEAVLRESLRQARAVLATIDEGGRALAAVLPEPPRSIWINARAQQFNQNGAIFGGKRYARALGIHLSRCPRCNRGLIDLFAVGLSGRRRWTATPDLLEQRGVPPETMAEWLRVHEELRQGPASCAG